MGKPAHKDIRIKFRVGDRNYEAVGFLEDETSLKGEEALQRTANENGGAVGDDDNTFLAEHFVEQPRELDLYWLITGSRNPNNQREVFCFYKSCCQGMRHLLGDLDKSWGGNVLIIRRCP